MAPWHPQAHCALALEAGTCGKRSLRPCLPWRRLWPGRPASPSVGTLARTARQRGTLPDAGPRGLAGLPTRGASLRDPSPVPRLAEAEAHCGARPAPPFPAPSPPPRPASGLLRELQTSRLLGSPRTARIGRWRRPAASGRLRAAPGCWWWAAASRGWARRRDSAATPLSRTCGSWRPRPAPGAASARSAASVTAPPGAPPGTQPVARELAGPHQPCAQLTGPAALPGPPRKSRLA